MRALLSIPLLSSVLCASACDDAPATAAPPSALPTCPTDRTLPVAAQHTASAWLGVWARDADHAVLVGGDATHGAIAAYVDGRLAPEVVPEGPALWWVWGADAEHVWAVGEGGRILRRDADGWHAESSGLGDKAVLWGVWGSGPTDLWAVGGANRRGGPKAVVLRSTGDGVWRRVFDATLPTEDADDPLAGRNLYKVWGGARDEVLLVGEDGLALRWDGAHFTTTPVTPRDLLFTVAGDGLTRYAVGGLTEGRAWRWSAGAWGAVALPPTNPINGVAVRADDVLLVGARGLLIQGPLATACRQRPDPEWSSHTLHAASLSGGAAWVVGGDLSQFTDGVILTDRPLHTVELP